MSIKKQIFLGLLLAIAVAVGYLETMIPLPVAMPGARLGLSNTIILTTIVVFGPKEGFTVALLKSFMLLLVTGAVTGFFYSFTGSLLSCVAMILAYRYIKSATLIGVSFIGSFFHNVGQVATAIVMVNNMGLLAYLPLLLLLGLFTGYFVGLTAIMVSRHLIQMGVTS
ncbi:heptaprenyl diphosphate synthase component I [Aedoeadaptatus nemausensis]|uniref:Heptaprenyl diphosphate synthase component I n=1 Tax=Aedoeadaptatus nemausensis TaxID=2582829 RepID=A0A6V6Y069_9FIRM|nr:Gx transporter family protein [Peptoniphilus nemausensis]CAC9925627.1 heptaprenyl diphosphate synthase component I [Peptoniphilus nemausensis]